MRKLLLIVSFICMFVPLMYGQTKPRIAVMDFDYATVRSAGRAMFGTDVDLGKGIADLLVEKLVNGGVFSVIERKANDTVINEQNFSNSDRADSNSAAAIGRILGVDAIVTGSITQFGSDDSNTGGAGSAVAKSILGKAGVSRSTGKAVVGITTRIINADTGEILASVTGKGESKRTSTSVAGLFGASGRSGSGSIDMGSSNFSQTIIGEAVSDAVNSVASQLHANSGKVTARVVKIAGRVIDVDGSELTLDVGGAAGVKVGDTLVVGRITREITNPDTGEVIRRVEEQLGSVVITEVDAQFSVGNYSGSSTAAVGDQVHN